MFESSTQNLTSMHLSYSKCILIIFVLGLTAPVADCDEGYYCPGGVSVSAPTEYPCPIGLHCPEGSSLPVPCTAGTFTNLSLQASCMTCPDRYYCVPEEVRLFALDAFILTSKKFHTFWFIRLISY